MTGSSRIPPKVDAKSAALLERAYNLKTSKDTHNLYRDWADTYDQTMLDGLGYLSPKLISGLLAENLPDKSALILDIGCGTGLAGAELATNGYENLHALDFSAEMLEMAAKRGIYSKLIEADLTKPIKLADNTYGGALCTGTFTHGHVGPECLEEIFRILKPDGLFAFSVNTGVWSELGFDSALEKIEEAGIAKQIIHQIDINFENASEPDSMLNLYQRL